MYVDSLLKVSAAQAVTASAVSTSSIDLGTPGGTGTPPKRLIASGVPMGFAISVDVAASLTSATFEIIQTTDAALSAGLISLVTVTKLNADLVAGYTFFLPFPNALPVAGMLRFIGCRYVPTGGAATITVSSYFTAHDLFAPLAMSYAKNYIP
jgi:hypothetical protein